MRQRFDKGSKWLIEHHGDAVLEMSGLHEVRRCLMSILGGEQIMFESPWINKIVSRAVKKVKQDSLLRILAARFGPLPKDPKNSRSCHPRIAEIGQPHYAVSAVPGPGKLRRDVAFLR